MGPSPVFMPVISKPSQFLSLPSSDFALPVVRFLAASIADTRRATASVGALLCNSLPPPVALLLHNQRPVPRALKFSLCQELSAVRLPS
jgi:hypothetical protein